MALGRLLGDLGVEEVGDVQDRLGLAGRADVHEDQVYNEKFEDEEIGGESDLEAEVDREMTSERYYKAGLEAARTAAPVKKSGVRGEDDDFDEDEEDDEEDEKPVPKVKTEVIDSGDRIRFSESPARSPPPPMEYIPPLQAAPKRIASVHDLYPSFEPYKVLDFSDLFTVKTTTKLTLKHRPLPGE